MVPLQFLALLFLFFITFTQARAEMLFYALSNDMMAGNNQILKFDNNGSYSVWNINWNRPTELYDPRDIAVDRQGNVYVADGEYIFKIDTNGNGSIFANKQTAYNAYGVAVDADGYVYANASTNSNTVIYKYDTNGILVDTFLYPPYQSLSNLTFGPDGALYSGDTFAGVVYRIDPMTGECAVFAEVDSAGNVAFGPDGTLYVGGYKAVYQVINGETSVALKGSLYSPYGLWVDADGTLYVGNNKKSWDNEILLHLGNTGSSSYSLFADLTEYQTITGIAGIPLIPEPSSLLLGAMAAGIVAVALRRRRLAECQ